MLSFEELKIPKNEVLRYLGYKGQDIDERLNLMIDSTIKECEDLILPRVIFSKYNKKSINRGVHIVGSNVVLEGEDIKNHLLFANEVVVMAITIGINIEKKINLYEKTSLTKAMILDACATAAVEEVCDRFEEYIKTQVSKRELGITFRYSPGYGDLSLDTQKDIINMLDAEKRIGLTVSDHKLLFPRKSVTAIIGLIPKDKEVKQRGCEVCKNYKNCRFRKEGTICGN